MFTAFLPPFTALTTLHLFYLYLQLYKINPSQAFNHRISVFPPLQFFLSDDDRVVKRGRGSSRSDAASQSWEGDASSTE